MAFAGRNLIDKIYAALGVDKPLGPVGLVQAYIGRRRKFVVEMTRHFQDVVAHSGNVRNARLTDLMTPDAPVLVTRDGHVMIITLNRPEARNAVNLAVHLAVGEAMASADADPEIRVVILTGAGDKAFCAGADLKALSRGESLHPADPVKAAWGFAGYVTHHISKPTIAAVNGLALGGGTELTLASDLAVAADTAMFGLPEVKRGIYAGAGGAIRIGVQLPPKVAMELLLTGDPISARQALQYGLVNAIVPQAEVLSAALALAARIAANAPLSVQSSKRIARGIVDGDVPYEAAAWVRNSAEGSLLMASQDAREGPRAFAEKRAPVWQAR